MLGQLVDWIGVGQENIDLRLDQQVIITLAVEEHPDLSVWSRGASPDHFAVMGVRQLRNQ